MTSTFKFNFESFKELDAPDLIINVWSYSDHLKTFSNCRTCKTYCNYCIEILRKRWEPEWGNFNKIISKLLKNDRNFINISKYSSENRHLIIDFLKKIEEDRKKIIVSKIFNC